MPRLREVMSGEPLAIGPGATMVEAAAVMVRGRVGSLLVRSDDRIVGILTERDVLRAAGASGDLLSTRVRDWMTRDPTTAPADDDVDDAIATMLDGGFRHLPITDGDDVVGIVSIRALLAARTGSATQAAPGADTDDPAPGSSPEPVQSRRERLFDATRALQAHAGAPVDDADAWRDALGTTVASLAAVIAAHIDETERPDGFFDELVRESGGRLTAAVRRLRREHERSTELLAELRSAIDDDHDPAELGRTAEELVAQLEAHRHRGSDLLWQAYGTEIGGDG